MKLVCAIIKPFKLEEVRIALLDMGIVGMTTLDVRGFGRQKGHTEIYRGSEYTVAFLPKVMVLIAVPDALAGKSQTAIIKAAKTDKIGDGWTWVVPMESVIRVRTEEQITDNDDAAIFAAGAVSQQILESSTPENTRAKQEILGAFSELGYDVAASVKSQGGSLVDFRLKKDGEVTLAIYRSDPTEKSVSYLWNVARENRPDHMIIVSDAIRSDIEKLCRGYNIRLITRDQLEVDRLKARSIASSPKTSTEIAALLEKLQELISRAGINGGEAAHVAQAEQAVRSLVFIVQAGQAKVERSNAKRALQLLEGTGEAFKGLAGIGDNFSKLLTMIRPTFE